MDLFNIFLKNKDVTQLTAATVETQFPNLDIQFVLTLILCFILIGKYMWIDWKQFFQLKVNHWKSAVKKNDKFPLVIPVDSWKQRLNKSIDVKKY